VEQRSNTAAISARYGESDSSGEAGVP
jgi:hypothetical protein